MSSETPEHSKKTFRMKELAQFVVKQLQPYQTAELADAQDRIKELGRQSAQQRKRTDPEAEIGPEPVSNSQSSQPSQSDGTASDSKRVRLPVKSSPSQAKLGKGKNKSKPSSKGSSPQEGPRTLTKKAFDPAFTVLGSNAPPTASPQAITIWIAKLRLTEELKAQLQQSCKVADATLKSCTEEKVDILHQRSPDFGFPVRGLMEAKDPEILKIVLAACASALAS